MLNLEGECPGYFCRVAANPHHCASVPELEIIEAMHRYFGWTAWTGLLFPYALKHV